MKYKILNLVWIFCCQGFGGFFLVVVAVALGTDKDKAPPSQDLRSFSMKNKGFFLICQQVTKKTTRSKSDSMKKNNFINSVMSFQDNFKNKCIQKICILQSLNYLCVNKRPQVLLQDRTQHRKVFLCSSNEVTNSNTFFPLLSPGMPLIPAKMRAK